jgi:hypothetical protein
MREGGFRALSMGCWCAGVEAQGATPWAWGAEGGGPLVGGGVDHGERTLCCEEREISGVCFGIWIAVEIEDVTA